ncbi:MAG: hypothetical protein RLZZ502_594 [Pseudomonadota bacterium]|jgi:uncharacterized protein YdhG (YjbR/CyaY superfamily)
MTVAASVAAYLAAQDPVKANTLKSIIEFLLFEFPQLECKLAWNVPHLHRGGKYVLGLAAYAQHLSLNPWSPWIIEDFAARLAPLLVLKRTVQLPPDWVLDKELLREMVAARLQELG